MYTHFEGSTRLLAISAAKTAIPPPLLSLLGRIRWGTQELTEDFRGSV
jgi:hypothetical protein